MVKAKDVQARLEDFDVRWNLAYALHRLGIIRPKWVL
jgi:hypothetical protein